PPRPGGPRGLHAGGAELLVLLPPSGEGRWPPARGPRPPPPPFWRGPPALPPIHPAAARPHLDRAAVMAVTPRTVSSEQSSRQAAGHVDNFTTTVCEGTWINTCCPLIPEAS